MMILEAVKESLADEREMGLLQNSNRLIASLGSCSLLGLPKKEQDGKR